MVRLTPAQRRARRRNVQESTGPRTPMGKKIASMNAVKHGMYSCPPIETMAVLGENPPRVNKETARRKPGNELTVWAHSVGVATTIRILPYPIQAVT